MCFAFALKRALGYLTQWLRRQGRSVPYGAGLMEIPECYTTHFRSLQSSLLSCKSLCWSSQITQQIEAHIKVTPLSIWNSRLEIISKYDSLLLAGRITNTQCSCKKYEFTIELVPDINSNMLHRHSFSGRGVYFQLFSFPAILQSVSGQREKKNIYILSCAHFYSIYI